jgi:hypothetical protein
MEPAHFHDFLGLKERDILGEVRALVGKVRH